MKKTLFTILSALILFNVSAQELELRLTVVDNQQKILPGLTVILIESTTQESKVHKTDNVGEVDIILTSGKSWSLSVGEMYNYRTLKMPKAGISTVSQYITYDMVSYKQDRRVLPDRSKITFTNIKQRNKSSTEATPTESVVIIRLKRENNVALSYYPIQLTSLKNKIIYTTKTNSKGEAIFLVPSGFGYEVDIDNVESFMYVDVPKRAGKLKLRFTYEPTTIKEKNINDTITQVLPEGITGTSASYLYEIQVLEGDGYATGENIYLKQISSAKVYKSKTNDEGKAYFLLPKKRKYLIDLDFQKDINVIDLTSTFNAGIGSGKMHIVYNPDPRLKYPEKYIPTIEDVLINEFNNFLTKQYPQPQGNQKVRVFTKWANKIINKKSKQAVLELGIAVTNDKDNKYGPPLNLSFVIDKSGSMAGYGRMEELKIGLTKFIEALRPNDIASLIFFESDAAVLMEAGAMQGRQKIFISFVNSINSGGGTNIYNGMILGYEEVLKNMNPDGVNKLILLTDGYGSTEVETIVNKSKEYNAKGAYISAIGVGSDYNQPLLRLLTNDGGGSFQHVEEANKMQNTFKNELSSLLFPVAKDLNVEISYNNKIVFSHLYGFNFTKGQNNTVNINVKNIYLGLNKLAIVKFDLKNINKTIENSPIIIKYSYFDYELDKIVSYEEKQYLKWEDSNKMPELVVEAEFKKLYAIAIMNQALKVMADNFSKDNYIEAENVIKNAISQINELYPEAKQDDIQKLYKTLTDYSNILKQYRLNKIKK